VSTPERNQKTRDFIQGLPPLIRTQVLQLLKDSLPLIDKSVKDYIDQVNNVLNSQIDHLECAVLGTGETLGADLKNAISLGNALPEPVQKLSADRDTVILSFLLGDKPTKYERSYSDLLYRAATTACQVGVAPEAVVTRTGVTPGSGF
jgi:hypothetical protein